MSGNSKHSKNNLKIYTDSSIFIRDMEAMITTLTSENREIYILGDFNYDTFKTSIYQMNSTDSENFTNILVRFNMYKLIHKRTRISPHSASLLDNIYTNMQITIDS